jgi:hypothetical protein
MGGIKVMILLNVNIMMSSSVMTLQHRELMNRPEEMFQCEKCGK